MYFSWRKTKIQVLDLWFGVVHWLNPDSIEEISPAVGEQLNAGTAHCRVAGGAGSWEGLGRHRSTLLVTVILLVGPGISVWKHPLFNRWSNWKLVICPTSLLRWDSWYGEDDFHISLLVTLIPTEYWDRFYPVHQTCILPTRHASEVARIVL